MKKDLSYYLNLKYPYTITEDTHEGKNYFIAEIPDLPGCGAHGRSIEDVKKKLEKAKELWIEISLKKGLSIPEPVSEDEFSGKFLLRIPAKLHMKLTLGAKKEDLSLNQYIRKILENNLTLESISSELKELREKVNELSSSKVIDSTAQFVGTELHTLKDDANLANARPVLKSPFGIKAIDLEKEVIN